ncbi:MAG: ArsA family ATPase [Bradymonadia bacterium]
MSLISALIENKRVVVCCGAGGVGKTTASAALGLAAARMGRRVLVVTIDPSKRLAEALGVDRNPVEPVRVQAENLLSATRDGQLDAWMLDPQLISDRVVRRSSDSSHDAKSLLGNRIYQNVTAMVAGMQEYTAVQALYEFVTEGRYDTIILDTPPSRDALRFLDAPNRVGAFLDRRIFNLFVPGEGSAIRRMTTRLLEKVMDVSFGTETRQDLQQFFQLFGSLLSKLNHNQTEMRDFFSSDAVSFLLVTAPTPASIEEARYFTNRAIEAHDLTVAGVLLNRSLAFASGWSLPDLSAVEGNQALKSALEKLMPQAKRELDQVRQHLAMEREVADTIPHGGWVCSLPHLGPGASTLDGLSQIADFLIRFEAKSQQT